MRIAGFLLALAGWLLTVAAVVLLSSLGSRTGFALAGVGVQILGIVLAARSHLSSQTSARNV